MTPEQYELLKSIGFAVMHSDPNIAYESLPGKAIAYPWKRLTAPVCRLLKLVDLYGVELFFAYQTIYQLAGSNAAADYWRSVVPAELDIEENMIAARACRFWPAPKEVSRIATVGFRVVQDLSEAFCYPEEGVWCVGNRMEASSLLALIDVLGTTFFEAIASCQALGGDRAARHFYHAQYEAHNIEIITTKRSYLAMADRSYAEKL